MYAVVRTYSGNAAQKLFDLIEQRKSDVEALIQGISGFKSYSIVRTETGGVTVTVCEDKAGTDESTQLASNWVMENAPDLGVEPPTIFEGPVSMHLG